MNKIIITALCTASLCGTESLRAQEEMRPTYVGSEFVEKIEPKATVVQDGELLGIAFDITLPARLIAPSEAYSITPELVSGERKVTLPAVLFEGRLYRTLLESRTAKEYAECCGGREYAARTAYRGRPLTYHYQLSVAFDPGSELKVVLNEETLRTCGRSIVRTASHQSILAADLPEAEPVEEPAPEAEAIAETEPAPAPEPPQTKTKQVYTDTFVFDSTDSLDAEAIGAFREQFESNVADAEILRVVLCPAASPDGPVAYNESLAQLRGETVRTVLIDSLGTAPEKIEIVNAGENWEGLLAALPAWQSVDADAIRTIVAGEPDPELRDRKIRAADDSGTILKLYESLRVCKVCVEYLPAEE